MLNPFFEASISSFKCFEPLNVFASGNSAIPFFLNKVTFLTSIKDFILFFSIKKSNLVLLPNFCSLLIVKSLPNNFSLLLLRAS